MRKSTLILQGFLLCLGVLSLVTPAFSAETQPGDACSTAGEVLRAGGPEEVDGQMMVCDGSNWKAVLEWDGATGRSLFQIADDTATCDSTKTGRLRYTGSTPVYEYCSGSCWRKFPSHTAENGLVGHWKFNESGNTSTAVDSAGSNDGSLGGFPADPSAHWVSGKLSNALDFDGSNDYVNIGNVAPGGTSMTIALWAKADSFPVDDVRLISKANGGSEGAHWWMISTIDSSGQKLRFRLKTNGSTNTLIASSGDISTSTWFHVVAVYDGSTMKLYKDAAQVGSAAKSGVIDTDSYLASIGRNGESEDKYWDGQIDDVRIYNRALSAQEISNLYNSGAGCE